MKNLERKIHECGGIVEFYGDDGKGSFLYCPKCYAYLKTKDKNALDKFPDGTRMGYNFGDWIENRKSSETVKNRRKHRKRKES